MTAFTSARAASCSSSGNSHQARFVSAVTRTLIEADASRKRRDEVVDKVAAAYILQGALDRLRHTR